MLAAVYQDQPNALPMAPTASSGWVTPASGTNTAPASKRGCLLAHGQRQPGLADPARAGQRHQSHPGCVSMPASSPIACSGPTSEVVSTGRGRQPCGSAGSQRGGAAWVSW
jgi:hypothetical protein